MKKLTIGILAHVDAGKTTLSEEILYETGSIRELGRVDNQDAFLDTYELEKTRGITIFSKEARFTYKDVEFTLLDTPGHVDFSAEMERTLQVLDYAILVISGADGVQGHTKTLWKLLQQYSVPTFLFVNKMDQQGTDQESLLSQLQGQLDDGCVDFANENEDEVYENIAVTQERLLELLLENGTLENKEIQDTIQNRKVFPVYFGSALKMQGVDKLLEGIATYGNTIQYSDEFQARVFKISRDKQGNRLTHLKITGGRLQVKDIVCDEEKINEIRLYSGGKYETVKEIDAGTICAVTGLTKTRPGQGLGNEVQGIEPRLEPVLTYRLILPEDISPTAMLPKLYELEEEEPELHIVWKEEISQIQVQLMGEVQVEILKSRIKERFGIEVDFSTGNIVYKETIKDTVEGVGHFEPLRHYAEVHLLLEPGDNGSGMVFAIDCSEDQLDKNWQRLILTHLLEREHKGVLTGSGLMDIKITLVAGRAHDKHTEGGDFREATYRAIRQGLMEAESVLLEPYYEYRLEVPESMVGRAMTDIKRFYGTFDVPENEKGMSILTGTAPVRTMQDYQREVIAYTKGEGKLFCSLKGYEFCHNSEEVIQEMDYDPERDTENPTGSVFCSHGSGYYVPWNEVKDHMQVGAVLKEEIEEEDEIVLRKAALQEEWIDTEEIDQILEATFHANQNRKNQWKKKKLEHIVQDYSASSRQATNKKNTDIKYLLIDGYNIIYAWEDLKGLAEENMDAARGKLLDILCDYQAIKGYELIVVFDAYRVAGQDARIQDYQNIHVVYTKEAETADQYIERFAHIHGKNYEITVATSDYLEQIIIRGEGCHLFSARELEADVKIVRQRLRDDFLT